MCVSRRCRRLTWELSRRAVATTCRHSAAFRIQSGGQRGGLGSQLMGADLFPIPPQVKRRLRYYSRQWSLGGYRSPCDTPEERSQNRKSMKRPLGDRGGSRPGWLPVLNRRLVGVGLLAAIGAAVTGCFFAPSDPEGPAIGLRVDDGVLTVYVPLCPGESVKSAEVDLPQGNGKVVMTVKGPTEPESAVVRFDATGWRRVSGSFRYTGQEFGVSVIGTVRYYGAGIFDRKIPGDLPQGTYDSDGRRVTSTDLDSERDCSKPG